MKKTAYFLASLLMVFSMISCASLNPYSMKQSDKAFTLSYKPALIGDRTSIDFQSSEFLKAEEDEEAKKELREPNYTGLPSVGIIVLRINDGDINGANPKNSLYILKDNTGRVIYRAYGKDTIPDYDVSSYNGSVSTLWYSIDAFAINDDSVEFPLMLRVVRFGSETVDITISKIGQ